MPDPIEIGRLTDALENRDDLTVVPEMDAFLGDQPTLDMLGSAAMALSRPEIFHPLLAAHIHDPSGTALDIEESRVISRTSEDGGRIESLHAVPLAFGEGWSARVHVWGEEQRLTDDLHTHTADFASVVLAGEFRDQMFGVAPPTSEHLMHEYAREVPEPVREVSLVPGEQRRISAGSMHLMSHTAVHAANVVPDGIAATLVVRRRVVDTSAVYWPGDERPGSIPIEEPVDGVETLARLYSAMRSE